MQKACNHITAITGFLISFIITTQGKSYPNQPNFLIPLGLTQASNNLFLLQSPYYVVRPVNHLNAITIFNCL